MILTHSSRPSLRVIKQSSATEAFQDCQRFFLLRLVKINRLDKGPNDFANKIPFVSLPVELAIGIDQDCVLAPAEKFQQRAIELLGAFVLRPMP